MNIRHTFFRNKKRSAASIIVIAVVSGWLFLQLIYPLLFEWYTGVTNAELTYDTSKKLSEEEFNTLVKQVTYREMVRRALDATKDEPNDEIRKSRIEMLINTKSFAGGSKFKHIKYFRDAGIRQYEGPKTCMKCHETMKVRKSDGTVEEENMLDNIINTVHFQFQSTAGGFTTYGYDGRKVNGGDHPIPVGKIDRACGIPGSFSWTGWAELIETKPDSLNGEVVMRSEGCGQCHIGGNYHPATEKMMPIGDIPEETKQGIDCLICHSQTYDMNYRYVIKDEYGTRWNQDRTLRAAMTVTNPTNFNCLNCHQHNMGGDTFAGNISAKNLGYKNKRILHEGAKRGNPFSAEMDVHASAGMLCTDCHVPEGHKIPRGTKGTDLVANDLPGKKIECENCHTSAPHDENKLTNAILNGHIDKIACETCHIKELEGNSVVLRDWTNPVWDEKEGMYVPADIFRSGKENTGFTFLWFNGNGTFLANALGNNPNHSDKYNPLMTRLTGINNPETIALIKENIETMFGDRIKDAEKYIDQFANTLSQLSPEMLKKRSEMINKYIKPLQDMGKSRIYPFKLFNARMIEDMSNEGPFGAMILPFDYAVYYEKGDPYAAVKKAVENPIVKRMYQAPFKYYMMDEFMKYFGVDEWSDEYPLDEEGRLRNISEKWMRQYGTLMVNHGIQRQGRTCVECHSEKGILNFEELGYTKERADELKHLPEIRVFASH